MRADAIGEPRRALSPPFNYLLLDADKVLTAFGKYGRYQMLTYFITNSVHMIYAINMMVMPFITKPAIFQCDFEANPEWVFTTNPDDQCHVMDNNNWTINCLQIPGSKYVFTSNESSLATDFGLVCDDYNLIDHGSSIFLLGGIIISPFISQLSDTYGRRFTFLFPLYLTVIANILCALSPTYTIFLIFRFISGVATTGFTTIGFVLCMESVASEFRSKIPALAAVTWVIGYTLAGLLSMFITNWRHLYLAISVPGLLTIPFYWLTPESLHWLITNRKGGRVQKYITTCENFNKMQISLHECRNESDDSEKEAARRTVIDIFTNKSILFHLIINAFILMVMNGTYWAFSLFSTELSDDGLTGYFLSGLIELPAGFFSVYLLHVLKRKTVSILALVLTSIFMCCALYLPITGNIAMIFPLLAKATNSIIWSSQPLIYSESVPTSIRNVFCGIVCFIGDFGSVVAPYLKRLEAIDKNAPSLAIAILSIIAAGCVLALPETKNKKLPEDIRDFDAGPLLRRFMRRQTEDDRKSEESSPLQLAEIESGQATEEKESRTEELDEEKRV